MILALADVDDVFAGIALQKKDAGVREIVHVHQLAARFAGAPHHHSFLPGHFCFVDTPDERGHHMAVGRVVVVAGAEKVGWHGGNVVAPVLPAIGLRKLDACNFCDRIPFIGRFQGAGQKAILAQRLFGVARIDTGRAEEHQARHPLLMRGADSAELDGQVVPQEIHGIGVIGENAADFGRGHDNGVRLHRLHIRPRCARIRKIELAARHRHHIGLGLPQPTGNGAPHHAAMTGHPDALSRKRKHIRLKHAPDFPFRSNHMRRELPREYHSFGRSFRI